MNSKEYTYILARTRAYTCTVRWSRASGAEFSAARAHIWLSNILFEQLLRTDIASAYSGEALMFIRSVHIPTKRRLPKPMWPLKPLWPSRPMWPSKVPGYLGT